jgi:CBS domain-containing protein
MVKLSEYATVQKDATLFEAVMALEEAQQKFIANQYRHRAILVYGDDNKIVGKVSILDVLTALEPKYKHIGDPGILSRSGFNPQFLRDMREQYALWDGPLHDISRKAYYIKVKDFMEMPSEGEFVDGEVTLDEAIHQLVMGHHHSLLVTTNGNIVGILRMVDVFNKVSEFIKECTPE